MEKISKSIEIGGKTFTLETGTVAFQATSAVLGRMGDTMVLVTIVVSSKRSDLDYFPLTVEYVERLYAGGRIKGSRWVKREGRPSDAAILTARLIDRSIRPLFPKNFSNEVQVVVTVLSVDGENDPDIVALLTTSSALASSSIPWNGPIGSVRIGRVISGKENAGQFLVNPTTAQRAFSDLDLVVSDTKEKTVMIEAGALQISEEELLDALAKSREETEKLITFIADFANEVGTPKMTYKKDELPKELLAKIEKTYKKEIDDLALTRAGSEGGAPVMDVLVEAILEKEEGVVEKRSLVAVLDHLFKKQVRRNVLEKGKRIDGRKVDEVRPINIQVSVLPRTHGSALFQRGQTQALTVVTLGASSLEQLIEGPEGEETKRYMHHYAFPPYSVGETGRVGFLSRREIGHGALAERALEPVIPKEDVFPYTIRVVSEILSSNGSTSMASVCGSTLSLMDAGVPLAAPVSGIAMGLVSDKEKNIIISDIMGIEDFTGDMDFKVAGTGQGITAVQLDVKIDGLSQEVMKDTLAQAKKGRLFILEKMLAVIGQSRKEVSQFAPKIALLHVPVEKIGEVIGPGGKVIRNIIATTGATVDVEDDGSVSISAPTQEAVDKAVQIVGGLTRQITVGEEFEGSIKRILPFGAFVEIIPGKEGMVHVSQMAAGFVKDPNEVLSIGQKVKVRVIEIDEMGRINLSMLPPGAKVDRQEGPDVSGSRFDRGLGLRSRSEGRQGPRRDDRPRHGFGPRERRQKPSFFPRDRFRKPSY